MIGIGQALVWDVLRALRRSGTWILVVAAIHVLAVVSGMVMVHTGNEFALTYRDGLVARAHESDPAAIAFQKGDRVNAALLDFSRNLFLGAVPMTASGLAVVTAFPIASHRGWVGGIVSVDSGHTSRLARVEEATYCLLTLTLQLIPYTLAAGAGDNVGCAYFRQIPSYRGVKWLGYPKEAIFDALRIYLLVVPLLLGASLWEFLAR